MDARHYGGLLLVAVLTACSHPKPTGERERIDRLTRRLVPHLVTKGFSKASAVGDCAPTDGPAMTVYLLDVDDHGIPPKPPYIRVTVDIDPVVLSESSVDWQNGGRGPGIAELCSLQSCHAISSGRIDFGIVSAGQSVEGRVDLRFTNNVRVVTAFRGRWVNRPYICGF
jgi:hypothetical protein